MPVKTPNQDEFYNRSAVHLAKELPGELVVTEAGIYVVSITEAFNGLIRKGMQESYDTREREPGELCVTNFRGNPQINVVGNDRSGKPQLTWLHWMKDGSKEVANPTIVKAIAQSRAEKISGPAETFDYAMEHLDGTSVLDGNSPLCIISNSLQPLADRKISFKEHAGVADNSGGIATLSGISSTVESQGWLSLVLKKEAERFGIEVEEMLNPNKIGKYAKQSKLLTRILRQLANSAS